MACEAERSHFAVAWQAAGAIPQERSFIEADFKHLWPAAQPDWLGSSSGAALLAALGHEIDRAELDVASIVEEADGFVVSGSSSGGHYANRYYLYSELRAGRAQPAANPGERTPSKSPRTSIAPVPKTPDARLMFVSPADKHNSPLRHRLHLMP